MDALIASSSAGFASTTGFSIDSVTAWMSTNLIQLFIGSGLGVLLSLRYWIVALVILGAIIYFAYRGFRFFQH